MSKDKFTEEIKGLLEHFEPEPPAKVWKGISFRLRFPNLLLGASSLFVVGFLSFTLMNVPEEEPIMRSVQSTIPDRVIVLIDSSFCEDGTVRLDTVYQEVPQVKESESTERTITEHIIADVDAWSDFMNESHEAEIDTGSYKKGKILYRNLCAMCHVTEQDRDLTGPSLFQVVNRREKEWLYRFTRNSQKMIAEGDSDAVALWNDWSPIVMNSFEDLKTQELDDLYYYIEQWEIGN